MLFWYLWGNDRFRHGQKHILANTAERYRYNAFRIMELKFSNRKDNSSTSPTKSSLGSKRRAGSLELGNVNSKMTQTCCILCACRKQPSFEQSWPPLEYAFHVSRCYFFFGCRFLIFHQHLHFLFLIQIPTIGLSQRKHNKKRPVQASKPCLSIVDQILLSCCRVVLRYCY